MRVFVQTRGQAVDYQFLGSAPGRGWWLEYHDHTAFEYPTIILRSRDGGWEAYLGAIPSARKDLAGRTVRFTLVLEGGEADQRPPLTLLEAWLDGAGAGDGRLGAALDLAFDERQVERMLATPDPGAGRDDEVDLLLRTALEHLAPNRRRVTAVPVTGTKFGSVRDTGDRNRFLKHASAILGGEPGQALLLNLVHTSADAAAVVKEQPAGVATVILASDPQRARSMMPVPSSREHAPVRVSAAPRASQPEAVCRVSAVGPAGVGTTTLVSAILADCQRLLRGRPVTMRAYDTATEGVIARNQEALAGALLAGELRPGGPRAGREPFIFRLLLDPGVPGAGIRLDLLHLPGGGLDPARPRENEEEWERCQQFVAESTVLVVPVDAAVLMETRQKAHTWAVPSILTTPAVADVARVWAQERNQRRDEPALVLLCPLKCESYFADNGGHRDRSEELRKRVRATYDGVLRAVREEATDVRPQILCCPIDTIGCVELQRAEWVPTRGRPEYEFRARYRARNPARRSVRGVDDLLGRLCEHLLEARRHGVQPMAVSSEADTPQQTAGFPWDVVHRLVDTLVGPPSRAGEPDEPGREQEEATRRMKALDRVLSELAGHPLSERAFSL